eukprot:TRINITY_DN720_c0_g1_i1.p1 TRINITY_DN720_c0_g1~~TRINITY_DN720_c0_g1_i1.p1  ORF type:complete len:318 (-),score=-36.67 TRINITY_DN720_c0_g1_i1:44-865(-)
MSRIPAYDNPPHQFFDGFHDYPLFKPSQKYKDILASVGLQNDKDALLLYTNLRSVSNLWITDTKYGYIEDYLGNYIRNYANAVQQAKDARTFPSLLNRVWFGFTKERIGLAGLGAVVSFAISHWMERGTVTVNDLRDGGLSVGISLFFHFVMRTLIEVGRHYLLYFGWKVSAKWLERYGGPAISIAVSLGVNFVKYQDDRSTSAFYRRTIRDLLVLGATSGAFCVTKVFADWFLNRDSGWLGWLLGNASAAIAGSLTRMALKISYSGPPGTKF